MNKIISIEEATGIVRDGDLVGLGGNSLNRPPVTLVTELVRIGRKDLRLLTTAGSIDVDMLCLAGLVKSVDAAFISYETEYGLAANYRKAVQAGAVKANEHSCYTLISGLRAAICGIPFMPVYGLKETDLLEVNDYFSHVQDPFSGGDIPVVKAYAPDVSLIHVDEADIRGNCLIKGAHYDDILLAKASKKVVVSAEKIVPESRFKHGAKANIPGFLIEAVVHIPHGAAPGSNTPSYEIDAAMLKSYLKIVEPGQLNEWIEEYRSGKRWAAVRRSED